MKICPNCGEKVNDDKKFCPKCGSSVTVAQAEKSGSSLNKNILVIAVAVIICVAIAAGALVMMNDSNNSDNGSVAVENNSSAENSVGTAQSVDSSSSSSVLKILDGTISTENKSDAKTLCRVYVGEEHKGEPVKISVLYWRNGEKLNEGKVVDVNVDSSGYIQVYSAKAFTKFPDEAHITLYDSSGDVVDEKDVLLETNDKVQPINR